MAIVDIILDLAALAFWLNWCSLRSDPLAKAMPSTIVGTVRRAAPSRMKGWHLLLCLGGLLLFRALLYWQLGSAINWTAHVRLNVVSLPFRSDVLSRMLLFSIVSFGVLLGLFYLGLLLLSLVNARSPDAEPLQKLVRVQLGPVDHWPSLVKLLLPLLVAVAFWFPLGSLLARQNIIGPATPNLRLQQGLVIGLSAYLSWQYIITVLLTLYILASYIYFGNHWFWSFINVTSRNFLAPLRVLPLRLGKVDLAPLLALAGVLCLAQLAARGLSLLYARLPL